MKGLLFINGKWVEPASEEYFDSYNPATGATIGQAADGNKEDVRRAIEAAAEAFPHWAGLTAIERADLLMKCHELMLRDSEQLAALMTTEQGKPIHESRGEVAYAASFVRWFAEEARRVYGETIPASQADKRLWVWKQPVGVVAAITPWNFPQAMILRKLAPALAAGCTVVVKPAEYTPLNAVALFRIFEQVGFPPGVVNLITTSRAAQAGEEILDNPAVRKIAFTGSTGVGKYLMAGAAKGIKKVSLELGGHAPFIVFADADLKAAVNGAIASKFRNAGQTCICANRIYVERAVKERFETMFVQRVSELKVGNGHLPDTMIGPLINEAAVTKSADHVKDALSKGARLLTGGKIPEGSGHYFEPTVITDVTEDMKVCCEETFGPVAPILAFDSEDEAVKRANDVPFGLAAYFYTNNLSRAIRVAERLEYGIIGLNDPVPSIAQAPFGGMKESGIGREGGKEGLLDYLETKYVSVKI